MEAVWAKAEKTKRLNPELRAPSEANRKEMPTLNKKFGRIVAAIQDTGFSRALTDRIHEFEAPRVELQKRLASVPPSPEIPHIHPNFAGIYPQKMARLAKRLRTPMSTTRLRRPPCAN